jgi:DNA-binding NarL/FixJ family response regulator
MPTNETTATESISAVLIDDHRVFLDAFGGLLQNDGRIDVVASAATSSGGVEAVETHQPVLVILDVDIDGTPVEQTLLKIQRVSPGSAVAIVTMHNHAPLRDVLLGAGARAFLSKSTSGAVLIDALVEAVATAPAVRAKGPAHLERESLTQREREVLRLISLAQSNKQIASELGITEGTVKRHAYSLFQKLGATSRVDAVRRASNAGLLS